MARNRRKGLLHRRRVDAKYSARLTRGLTHAVPFFEKFTLVSVLYPGLPLSANKISAFLERLGQDITKQQAFFHARLESVCENDHIIIDGTLKQNTSKVNDLSEFSRKARVKGC